MEDSIAARHVALIGLSGVGKSSVGPLVAEALRLPFLDTDREVEKAAGVPIHRIFREQGEAAFRALEAEQVQRALEAPPAVLSLGGGAVLDPDSREFLWLRATVVWLRARPEVLAQRLLAAPGAEERPLLAAGNPEARLRVLLEERESVYSRAHVTVDAEAGSPTQVAAILLAALGQLETEV
ncbi:MAG: shikimate kinase [Chloroflexota bacterium]|nr:shikimate kinase [Chloroflexota bacterium]